MHPAHVGHPPDRVPVRAVGGVRRPELPGVTLGGADQIQDRIGGVLVGGHAATRDDRQSHHAGGRGEESAAREAGGIGVEHPDILPGSGATGAEAVQ